MMKMMSRTLGFVAALALATPVLAQEATSDNRVAANTDWSVFVEDSPQECWGVSKPKESSLKDSNGNATQGRRGEILLFVFYRPGASVQGQVAFTGGYPFKPGSSVNVNISGNEFEMFTDGEWAWPASPADDSKIITAWF
jgi:hypothetical protein